ncbi:MAG TPA: hypothetical protein VHX63_14390 [Acidobacteriaceae bacterium]|jgi:hypothetical protein|nr:hypothetical protein [Acidobacteriaceae bacterium]
MQVEVNFVGKQADEQTPAIALYAMDARGQATKVAALENGKLNLAALTKSEGQGVIALGPDISDPTQLDPNSLLHLRLAASLAQWRADKLIELPPQWWRQWLHFRICLSGKVSKCFPWIVEKVPLLKSIALGKVPFPPIERCSPICSGIVEVWEQTCCCFPFYVIDVPPFLEKLKTFLAANPVMFPPPRPNPGPLDNLRAQSIDRAIAAGQVDLRFSPNTQLQEDLLTLESSTAQDAVQYVLANPRLWPIWCRCTSAKLGETSLNPDGSFSYCYEQFPFEPFTCRRSYFYKVKQWLGGQWVYVYDGGAAYQYFNADTFANLSTLLGYACGTVMPPPPGTDFVILQQIGATLSYALHSNYGGVDGSNNDLTQTGPYSVVAPAPNGNAGLVNDNNAPWCKTLSFMLYFDPGMEALGAYYYRMSVAPADVNGNPVGTMQLVQNAIAWSKYVLVGTQIEIEPQVLGPVTASNGVNGLFLIPYNADADWLSDQAHQYFDTRTLNPTATGVPGPGNGRFLLAVEIFDKNGNRLVPPGVTPGTGDKGASFQYLRMLLASGPGSTANVQQAALTHIFWADNRPVVAEIDSFDLNGHNSSQECQFLRGQGTATFQVGYRAYHTVLSDPNPPNPLPPSTFMAAYDLWWERGLNGGSGTFDSGGDADQPSTRAAGPPEISPAANGILSNLLPSPGPTACSFAITLNVTSKHTDGSGHFTDLDATAVAAVALSLTS